MKNTNALQQDLTQRLSDSVERLQQQADKVQYWASAITGISQPVPDYEPESTSVARYIKAARPARKRRRRKAANQNERTEDNTRSTGNGSGC
jgi:conjugal transfer/entry exclusion protein